MGRMMTAELVLAFGTLLAGAIVPPAVEGPARISAAEAHEKSVSGELLLIDIRKPEEWITTGIGEGARPISIHVQGFLERLEEATGGDPTARIALICAMGSRSAAVQRELAALGYSNVIDVAEGMSGGPNGHGWIGSGLPVKTHNPYLDS
jgi:rhodanese-related sulfurtransferase